MKKNTIKTIMADNAVNTGRQPELDLVKAVFIVLMPVILIPMCISASFNPVYYVTNNIFGGLIAFPAAFFLMGVSIAFYKSRSFGDMLIRGIKLFLAGLALNVFKLFIPYIIGFLLTSDYQSFIEPLKYLALSDDMFTFAAISVLVMAVLIRYKASNKLLVVSGLGIAIAGDLFAGTDTGLPFLNSLIGYLVSVKNAEIELYSFFPFCNWFVIVVGGYLFGKSLLRVKNKKLFYRTITWPAVLIFIVYFVISLISCSGLFREEMYAYFHIRVIDALASIAGVTGFIGIAYYIDGLVSAGSKILISRISRSVSWSYAVTATLCTYLGLLSYAMGFRSMLLTFPGLIVAALLFSPASICLSVYIKEHVSGLFSRILLRIPSISQRFFTGLVLFAVSIALLIGYYVGSEYWNDQINNISSTAASINKMCAALIDPDRAVEYLEDKTPDEYFSMIQNSLDGIVQSSGIEYVYVIKVEPETRSYKYIWDTEHLGLGAEYSFEPDLEEAGVYNGLKYDSLVYSNQSGYGNMATAFYPVYTGSGDLILICTEVSVSDIISTIVRFVIVILESMLVIMVVALAIFYSYIRRNILNPIDTLSSAVDDMVNQLDEKDSISIGITTGDEIESLSHNYENMFIAMKSYMKAVADAAAEKESIKAELSIATDIQASMLPSDFPDTPEFSLYAAMDPAKEVGGDFYDFFMIDKTHLAFVVADVSGKGIPAALFMVIAKTLLRDHTEKDEDLAWVFTRVNDILVASDDRGMFVTAFEGIVDLKTGEVVFVNAGHEPPFIRTAEGYRQYRTKPGLVLSCMPGTKYQTGTFMLEEGDAFFQYTDGVTEATNVHNELYGFDRLSSALNANAGKSAAELLPAIKADIDAFVGTAPQFDDITMLCFEFKKKMKDD